MLSPVVDNLWITFDWRTVDEKANPNFVRIYRLAPRLLN